MLIQLYAIAYNYIKQKINNKTKKRAEARFETCYFFSFLSITIKGHKFLYTALMYSQQTLLAVILVKKKYIEINKAETKTK